MKRIIVLVIAIFLLPVTAAASVLPLTLSPVISYDYAKHSQQAANWSQLDNELNSNLLSHDNDSPYLELQHAKTNLKIGMQNYTLNSGLIAQVYGVLGVKTTFKSNSNSAFFFYGNNGQNMVAADFTGTFQKYKNIKIEASYFQTDSQFIGIAARSEIAKHMVFSVETASNLTNKAQGYLVTTKFGSAQRPGEADLTVSYRYIESGAVSGYSSDAEFDYSKGIRLETNYNFGKNLSLAAYKDFAKGLDNSVKDEYNVTLSWTF